MTERDAMTCLAMLGSAKSLQGQLKAWLEPHGWACIAADDVTDPAIAAEGMIALFLLDSADPSYAGHVLRIRAAPLPLGATPILLVRDAPAPPEGVSAIVPAPLDRASTLAVIEQWAGPLRDHGFRSPDNPAYRLVRLGGRAVADRLLARFAEQLTEALAWLDAPDPESRLPHQIAGVAGMIGFERLSAHWRAIDAGDAADPEAARAHTQAVIARIRSTGSTD
ncbi:MAG: hypothetical protein J0G94_14435 [Sphingomonadales bacterium]|nr:hypothetical protein [Sphingomonadales bacterium]